VILFDVDCLWVLFVEDECLIFELFLCVFVCEGFELILVCMVVEVFECVVEMLFDVVLFDVMLFDGDGCDVLCEFCKIFDVFVIMFIVWGIEIDCVVGFEFGVDDYVVKLFLGVEVIVCLCAVLRWMCIVFVLVEVLLVIIVGFFMVEFVVWCV